jgi:hypothetical protein
MKPQKQVTFGHKESVNREEYLRMQVESCEEELRKRTDAAL